MRRPSLALLRMLLAALLFPLIGCGTMLKGQVTQFHELSPGPKRFVLVLAQEQQGSLEFRSYAGLIRSELLSRGWQEVAGADADVAVFFQAQISQGRSVAFSYPILGTVPTGSSYTTGTVFSYGNTATINATTTQGTTVGVTGYGTGTRTEFDRALQVTMYSAPEFRQTGQMHRLYEGVIYSTGSNGTLAAVMPTLVHALFDDFPGISGRTRAVTTSIR